MHGWTGQYFPEVDNKRQRSGTVLEQRRSDPRPIRARSVTGGSSDSRPGSLVQQLNLNQLTVPSAAEAENEWKEVPMSDMARLTINPIRKVVQGEVEINPSKRPIVLSIGDPTVFGNLPVANQVVEGALDALMCGKWHGYGQAVGLQCVREAVAKHCSTEQSKLTADDVVITHGCSGALEFCISVLANRGDNILLPRPGFPIYGMLAEPLGVELRYYDLLPERDWEVDISQLSSLVDEKTKAIVVNNPSNPCGSVYTKQHLLEILQVAESHFLPIISDDVYANFTFRGYEYHSLAALSQNVPILSCGALTKRFLLPNWRVGWVCFHDKHGVLKEVRSGMWQLATRLLGPSTIMQAAVPHILEAVPQSFFDQTVEKIHFSAKCTFEMLSHCRGLLPVMPHGAMYLMCGIRVACFPEFKNDVEWTKALMKEESVITLPAACFNYPNYFRIVLTAPIEHIEIACDRIRNFCSRHFVEAELNSTPIHAQSIAEEHPIDQKELLQSYGLDTESLNDA